MITHQLRKMSKNYLLNSSSTSNFQPETYRGVRDPSKHFTQTTRIVTYGDTITR